MSTAPLRTPAEHGQALHPAGRPGHVSIVQNLPARRERAVPVGDLAAALPELAGSGDCYLSVNRFWFWRRIVNLAELGALYADLDYYRSKDHIFQHPRGVLEDAIGHLERNGIPAPSLAIGSGRGLYLYWLHRPVPRQALPRWNAAQKHLCKVLAPFGADGAAKDAARYLRVVGTRNSKSGVMVEALTPAGDVWDFDILADEVLPMTRAELHDLQVARATRRPRESRQRPPKGFTQASLWERRLRDLQHLRDLRWFGEPMPDFRNRWAFIAGTAVSWIAQPATLTRELYQLAREIGGWTESKANQEMHTIFSRVRMYQRGEKVEYAGQLVDPRYRFKSQTLIEWLEITPEEEREMVTIISDDERRRRHREKERERKRLAGEVEMTRSEYLELAAHNRRDAHRLKAQGLSLRKIADHLKISHTQVRRLLSQPLSPEWNMSVPLYRGVASSPEGGTSTSALGSSVELEPSGAGSEEQGPAVDDGGVDVCSSKSGETLHNTSETPSGDHSPPVPSAPDRADADSGEEIVTSVAEVFELARARFGLPSPVREGSGELAEQLTGGASEEVSA